MKTLTFSRSNTLIIFWLGVLTGALLVMLLLMYKQRGLLESSTLNTRLQTTSPTRVYSSTPLPEIQSTTTNTSIMTSPNPIPLSPNPIPLTGY